MTVHLDEETHTYVLNGQVLRSVTTWINSFFPQFDADEERWDGKTWAQATAEYVRDEIKGNGPVTKKYPDPYHYAKKLFGDSWEQEVEKRKGKKVPITARTVKKLWEQKGKSSSDEGTRVHNLVEACLTGREDVLLMDDRRVVAAVNRVEELKNKYGYSNTIVLAEEKVALAEEELAGTIDCLMLIGDDAFYIADWKTNEDIEKPGYKNGIHEPLTEHKDKKLFTYALQLSVYAYIIERNTGRKCKGLMLFHLKDDKATPYPVEYHKGTVEAMLKYDAETGRTLGRKDEHNNTD